MGTLRVLWRDADRLPYLHTVRDAALTYGTTIELLQAKSREFGELLLDDRVDVVAENYWNQQMNCAVKGWPLVALAAAVNEVNEGFVVGNDVTSLDDLHGKRIAIRGMHPTDYSDPVWIAQLGLGDAELVFVPEAESGRWAPWKRVVAGDCAAAIVTNLFLRPALEAGLKTLDVPTFGFLGNVVYTTTLEKRDGMRADMVNLVRAAFDAVETFKTNKAAVLQTMQDIPADLMQPPNITLATAEDREYVYASLRDELADPPIPTPEAITNFYTMLLSDFPEMQGRNPLLMWDLSIVRSVLEERATSA
jgi:hypothetical protein